MQEHRAERRSLRLASEPGDLFFLSNTEEIPLLMLTAGSKQIKTETTHNISCCSIQTRIVMTESHSVFVLSAEGVPGSQMSICQKLV